MSWLKQNKTSLGTILHATKNIDGQAHRKGGEISKIDPVKNSHKQFFFRPHICHSVNTHPIVLLYFRMYRQTKIRIQ